MKTDPVWQVHVEDWGTCVVVNVTCDGVLDGQFQSLRAYNARAAQQAFDRAQAFCDIFNIQKYKLNQSHNWTQPFVKKYRNR